MDCDCTESCVMADQFTPATREIMVFTKSAKRYFDLDAVRGPYSPGTLERGSGTRPNGGKATSAGRGGGFATLGPTDYRNADPTTAGAPPLDWWKIDPDIPYTPQHEGEQMPATFYVGDAIEVMGKLPENSVDLILTSPPFLALRSYLPADHPDKGKEGGSQATPGEFIDWLLDVAEACARVLAPHGSLCIELGDTYSGADNRGSGVDSGRHDAKTRFVQAGPGWPLAKSLSLIPESFRFAMVYGFNPHTGRTTEPWRLRNVIRWVRPNPPVGALGDKFRPATSELMVFCKSAKRYFDLDAVREPYAPSTLASHTFGPDSAKARPIGEKSAVGRGRGNKGTGENFLSHSGAPPLDWWNIPLLEGEEETRYGPKAEAPKPRSGMGKLDSRDLERAKVGLSSGKPGRDNNPLGAPPLDWWNIPPGGYEGAHYAVFPPELCVKPVKAMCPEKVCRVCGEPSRRIVEKSEEYAAFRSRQLEAIAGGVLSERDQGIYTRGGFRNAGDAMDAEYVTAGWSDCGHDDWRPGMVLDCFGGSGTTALVATGHGRDCILIDLDERNYDLALERVGPFILTRGEDD